MRNAVLHLRMKNRGHLVLFLLYPELEPLPSPDVNQRRGVQPAQQCVTCGAVLLSWVYRLHGHAVMPRSTCLQHPGQRKMTAMQTDTQPGWACHLLPSLWHKDMQHRQRLSRKRTYLGWTSMYDSRISSRGLSASPRFRWAERSGYRRATPPRGTCRRSRPVAPIAGPPPLSPSPPPGHITICLCL